MAHHIMTWGSTRHSVVAGVRAGAGRARGGPPTGSHMGEEAAAGSSLITEVLAGSRAAARVADP